ncbi:hypothetical protein E3N88_23168 [Mikania micrantha]|uniref:Uncharacterized protein n=1 Tax=Mikania micrantha TaxID=192012 RepID=A0A5N6NEA3_9ASTR|nr:hypothetical protein E3N88_23168 [Mikania micrantha]
MSLHRVAPTIAHRFNTALKGGHQNMRRTRNVYRNISRDIRLFIGDRDVQLFLQRLKERSDNLPNFEYEVLHDGRELKAIFWADDVSRTSYQTSGDVLAFDATYSPTNQDPSMRIAVSNIFKKAAHRLCMWHIMRKLPSKESLGTSILSGDPYVLSYENDIPLILQIREIPDRYVSKRWRREVLPNCVYSISNRLSVDTSELAALRNEVMDCVNVCVDRLCTRVDDLSCFAEKMKEIKKEVLSDYPVLSAGKRRAAAIVDLVGRLDESDNALMPPQGIRNKGCGTNRRLVGPGEMAVEKA